MFFVGTYAGWDRILFVFYQQIIKINNIAHGINAKNKNVFWNNNFLSLAYLQLIITLFLWQSYLDNIFVYILIVLIFGVFDVDFLQLLWQC